MLTDGRANIALDGSAHRQRAAADAQMLARVLRMSAVDGIVIDTGQRPDPALKALSDTLLATYLPLPCADAKQLSEAVAAALAP